MNEALQKDCDCRAPQSTDRHWVENEYPPGSNAVTVIYCYDPRLGCEKCHKPWRPVPDIPPVPEKKP